MANAQQFLKGPDAGAYNIPGMPDAQNFYGAVAGGNLDTRLQAGAQNSDYGRQGQAADLMYQTALGRGPSVADQQMQQGLAQTQRNIASSALSNQAGSNPGLTQRNMLNAMSNADSGVLANSGLQRATEQLGAMNAYGGLASTMRGQSQGQEGLAANTDAANAARRIAGQQGKDAYNQQQGANNIALSNAQTAFGNTQYNAHMGRAAQNAQNSAAVVNGVGSIADKGAGLITSLAGM